MNYNEYIEPNTDITTLETSFIPNELYKSLHETTVILCHDVFIRCAHANQTGLLLVTRLKEPAKNVLWPIGGRVQRGIPTEISLSAKAKSECNLELTNIQYLGTARTFFMGEPFGHGHGTDTLNLVYIADGKGELILDPMHESPLILAKESHAHNEHDLPEYVQDFLNIITEKNLW